MDKHQDSSSPSGFRYELTEEDVANGLVAFAPGPLVNGAVSLPDGTVYDITEEYIAVKHEHVGELHLAIHRMHRAVGRHLDVPVPELEDVSLPAPEAPVATA